MQKYESSAEKHLLYQKNKPSAKLYAQLAEG